MRSLKILPIALLLGAMPLPATAQQPTSLSDVVDKIVSQEQVEVQSLKQSVPGATRPKTTSRAVWSGRDCWRLMAKWIRCLRRWLTTWR
jgi:hypothetical protein